MRERPQARGFVLIAGPDGAGKSTVVDAIVAAAASAGIPVSRAHYRPGLIAGRPSGAPVTDPHAKPPRSAIASLAKLGVLFLDQMLGGHTRWRVQRRSGLLLLERGWYDMAVDTRRYRLPARFATLVKFLGPLLPRPDIVLLLTGDAETLHARKPEIGVAEVNRQIRRWREIATTTARRVAEVDTVRTSPQLAAETLLRELTRPPAKPWRSVPLTPRRLALCTSGRARPALGMYHPQSARARVGASLAYGALTIPGRRMPEPLPNIGELWPVLGLDPDGVAAMRSSTAGRMLLSVCQQGRMQAVVKVGTADDAALRHEAAMLAEPMQPDLPIGRPRVAWSGEWREYFVLMTWAAQRSSSMTWTPNDVVPLAYALASAGPDGAPVTHGDLTPWNLVRTADGPVLLDWESARWSDEPLHDLAHFVVQGGALLGRYGPERAVSLLCDEKSPGARLLRRRGLDADAARPLLHRYLAESRPTESRAIRFRTQMLKLVHA